MENKFKKGHHMLHRESEGVLNGLVEVSQKIDGANASVYISDEGILICRSRNNELIDDKANNKMFARFEEYMRNVHATTPFDKGLIYFMENCVKHTIFYGEMPACIGFSVLDIEIGLYLKDWAPHFDSRGIPRVNFEMLENPSVSDLDKYLKVQSEWGTEKVFAEGIFLKNYGDDTHEQIFSKIVIEEFLEKNAEVFGAPTPKMDDTEKVVEMYCTIPRIHKGIFKLRDELGMDIEMQMMTKLPLEVYNDILEEEIIAISQKFQTINLKRMRGVVSSKCAQALKDFILEQAR